MNRSVPIYYDAESGNREIERLNLVIKAIIGFCRFREQFYNRSECFRACPAYDVCEEDIESNGIHQPKHVEYILPVSRAI